jgi:hypothetical protein
MSEYVVDLHIPGESHVVAGQEYLDPRLTKYGRADIGMALEALGLTVAYSRRNAFDVDGQAALEVARFERSDDGIAVYVSSATVATDGIHAIRNLSKVIDKDLPEINAPIVREFALNKALTNDLFVQAGVGKVWYSWDVSQSIDDILLNIPGDDVVLKPRDGSRAIDVDIMNKRTLSAMDSLRALKDRPWIIEEKLDFTPALPVVGRDETQQQRLAMANMLGLPKELRAYSFGRAEGELVLSYVARIGVPGYDTLISAEWAYLDPDSIPEEMHQKTQQAFSLLEASTGQTQMLTAIDWAYVLKSGSPEPEWIGMEINGTEPTLISQKADLDVGREHTAMVAQLLHRVAVRGGTQ